ncbi:CCA tRNA nucleotidyltransferase [Maricaulis virginensis]|uniref:Poly(A) polymerase/tRNA-nucleotidyltransferase n=1 Tax=Maricaulis virginensis TaxID=144022 RepID=A0A9W6MMZ0_9PROT|nr:CCA tRNA nucleotidyltransferase [Maricaulis virginensis]GLK51329.1 poly(A) polymerase/tRNA-nucleotidyltransferase [Maricaulis virginensis]
MTRPHLDPARQTWMQAPETVAVMEALDAARPGGSRFVGGCVRNALLGERVADIDIATQLLPDETIAAAKAAGLKAVPTGKAHGTITVIADGVPFEVTTLRRDVSTDGRRAVVTFTEDWAEDAQRRDFRLNALYADRTGAVTDPTGGLEDVAPRRFVFVGTPENRIREDYLRILRLFRFEAWYGAGDPDPAGLAAAAALKDGLHKLSVERVWAELKKLLAARDPRAALAAMAKAGILDLILGVNGSLRVLGGIVDQDVQYGLAPDSLLRFVALADGGPERIRTMAAKLKMSNAETRRLEGAVDPSAREDVTKAFSDMAAAERAIMALGARAFEDQARLQAAGEVAPPPRDWTLLAKFAREWAEPEFPVKGGDLILLGYEPGPMLGDALDELKAYWIAERFEPSKDELIARLKTH